MTRSPHSYQFTVLENHLDTFSHVNNATYLELFEQARWDWITKNGYGLDKIKATGLGPVVLEIQISFKKELKLRAEVIILSEVVSENEKISKLKQIMINKIGDVFCEAEFTFALFDLNRRKIVKATEDWKAALK